MRRLVGTAPRGLDGLHVGKVPGAYVVRWTRAGPFAAPRRDAAWQLPIASRSGTLHGSAAAATGPMPGIGPGMPQAGACSESPSMRFSIFRSMFRFRISISGAAASSSARAPRPGRRASRLAHPTQILRRTSHAYLIYDPDDTWQMSTQLFGVARRMKERLRHGRSIRRCRVPHL